MSATILLVDDSATARRTLRHILESGGYQVIEAQDGLSALERYSIERPDIVFLDLVMKGMYGLDVLTKLREMDPSAPVIVATADVQSSTRELAETGGASHVVNKPFQAQQVLDAVRHVLERRRNAAH
jgi:two-component system chemotaxis response regulator CheY